MRRELGVLQQADVARGLIDGFVGGCPKIRLVSHRPDSPLRHELCLGKQEPPSRRTFVFHAQAQAQHALNVIVLRSLNLRRCQGIPLYVLAAGHDPGVLNAHRVSRRGLIGIREKRTVKVDPLTHGMVCLGVLKGIGVDPPDTSGKSSDSDGTEAACDKTAARGPSTRTYAVLCPRAHGAPP